VQQVQHFHTLEQYNKIITQQTIDGAGLLALEKDDLLQIGFSLSATVNLLEWKRLLQ
jgi:hypothetical protein